MKKLIYGGLFLASAGIGMFACTKSEIEQDSVKRNLSSEQIEEIGKMHNKYLELAFKNFNYKSSDLTKELQSQYQHVIDSNNLPVKLDVSNVELTQNLTNLEENLSKASFSIIEEAVTESNNVRDVRNFTNYINSLESKAIKILPADEQDAVLVTLCVLRNSAYFWTPKSRGGSGKGENIIEEIKRVKNLSLAKGGGYGWLAADGAAAGTGMIGTAVSAAVATGPVGWGFLLGVGVGSGIASGWYALTH